MSEQKKTKVAVFAGKQIRKVIYEGAWWFVIVDVVAVLTDSANPAGYLKDMRRRDLSLSELFKGGGKLPPPPCAARAYYGRTSETPVLEHRRNLPANPVHPQPQGGTL